MGGGYSLRLLFTPHPYILVFDELVLVDLELVELELVELEIVELEIDEMVHLDLVEHPMNNGQILQILLILDLFLPVISNFRRCARPF